MTKPNHTCTPPAPGTAAKVAFYTCPSCSKTWLLLRCDDRPDEWRPVAQDK